MIIGSLRSYFLKCPLIDRKKQIRIDYLGVKAVEYVIEPVPSDIIVKQYVDGGALKQYLFTFGSREYYSADIVQNMANSGFYQEFSEWIYKQNELRDLPVLDNGKTSTGLEVLSSGYLFDASEDTAKYQIQLRLLYYED